MTRNSLTDDPLEAVGVAVQEADDLLSWDYPAFADEASLEFPGFDILEDCLFVTAQGRGCLGDGKEVLIGHLNFNKKIFFGFFIIGSYPNKLPTIIANSSFINFINMPVISWLPSRNNNFNKMAIKFKGIFVVNFFFKFFFCFSADFFHWNYDIPSRFSSLSTLFSKSDKDCLLFHARKRQAGEA